MIYHKPNQSNERQFDIIGKGHLFTAQNLGIAQFVLQQYTETKIDPLLCLMDTARVASNQGVIVGRYSGDTVEFDVLQPYLRQAIADINSVIYCVNTSQYTRIVKVDGKFVVSCGSVIMGSTCGIVNFDTNSKGEPFTEETALLFFNNILNFAIGGYGLWKPETM